MMIHHNLLVDLIYTHAVTRLQPGPEPPWLGPHPGLPSAPLDSEDDSSPPSEEQTHNHHYHDICLMDEDTHMHAHTHLKRFFLK